MRRGDADELADERVDEWVDEWVAMTPGRARMIAARAGHPRVQR